MQGIIATGLLTLMLLLIATPVFLIFWEFWWIVLLGQTVVLLVGSYIILKKNTSKRRRKIISMAIAGAILVLFIIHTVLLVVATKNYEKSLKNIRDSGMPVTLEEIIIKINESNRKLLPEENAAEIIKPYEEWWETDCWQAGTPRKHMENNSVYSKEEVRAFNKLYADYDNCNIDKFNEKEISLLESYISKHKGAIGLVNKMANCKGFYVEIDRVDPLDSQLPNTSFIGATFKMLCANIFLKERDNKINEAISDLKKYNYVDGIVNFKQTWFPSTRGIGEAIDNISMVSKIMKNKNLTEAQCEDLIKLLEEIEKRQSNTYTCSLNNDRARIETFLDSLYGYEKNKGMVANAILAISRYINKPLIIRWKAIHNELMLVEIKSSKEEYFVGNKNTNENIPWYAIFYKGHFLCYDLKEITKRVFTERNKLIMLKTELLVQYYKFKTGKFPVLLQDIKKVTGYEVPKDIMTGKEFKYELKGDNYTIESEYKEK
ncbi:MAG: hypothetical protein V1752_05545 [Candidatus Firestonebacteria bacterium]